VVWWVAVFGDNYKFEVSCREAVEEIGHIAAVLDGEGADWRTRYGLADGCL
jgi:hypothetical protein